MSRKITVQDAPNPWANETVEVALDGSNMRYVWNITPLEAAELSVALEKYFGEDE